MWNYVLPLSFVQVLLIANNALSALASAVKQTLPLKWSVILLHAWLRSVARNSMATKIVKNALLSNVFSANTISTSKEINVDASKEHL